MNKMHDQVPDRWLRIFVEAASASSFTAAADVLGIGQSAVSHAMSRLENATGVVLFERGRSGARLTPVGEVLADSCRAGFSVIDQGVNKLARSAESASVLTLSVSTSLATYWLLPRLAGFKLKHPDIELRCITNDTDKAVGHDGADMWIPLGRGTWSGLTSVELCAEQLYPVAAPELLARAGLTAERLMADPTRMLELPMLHLEERYAERFNWERWFGHNGVEPSERIAGVISNDYSLILQAALNGQGIAIGWHHIVSGLVDEGRLLPLSSERITTDQPFVVLSPGEPPIGSGAAILRDWLATEGGRDQTSAAAPILGSSQ